MKDNVSYYIGQRLQRLRQAKGLTLSGLAAKAGVARSLIYALEAGRANPTLATLWALAQALEVPFSELVQAQPVGEEGLAVQLIEQSRERGGGTLEVYRMDLYPHSLRHAEPHESGICERVIGLRGKARVGPPPGKEVGPGEEVDFPGDVPHLYASEEGASLLVFLHYPPVFWPKGEMGSEEKASLALREVGLGVGGVVLEGRWLAPGFWEGVFVRWGGSRTYLFSLPFAPLPRFAGRGLLGEAFALLHAPVEDLRPYRESSSLLLRALAWEGLLLKGEVADPTPLLFKTPEPLADSSAEGGWESRIPVDLYTQVELLHPGYARQPLFLAHGLETLGLTEGRVLDVGTGPGHHLLLLLELLPRLKPVAVEPSLASRQALAQLLPGVEVLPVDFTGLEVGEAFPLVLSVGSSHRMSTWNFLDKAYRLLRPGGFLAVADEFVSPFATREERIRHLVLHHTAYLVPFPLEDCEALWALRILALQGETRGLRRLAEEALQEVRACSGPFASFASLELQALLAGLDYEVETKTSAARFLELASAAGFQVEQHLRLFATHGSGPWDGGTHLFLLRRPG
ncbi:helix-turn-helix domain-containing protein [Thermus albus]|uniref:helix-turn-helix domain-containing protein n=1 Tax=Thermus albus TaxID=2908146 RepID=UPI001FAB2473|nr:helix-turn-helix domain-containing protein [Thermus albus]